MRVQVDDGWCSHLVIVHSVAGFANLSYSVAMSKTAVLLLVYNRAPFVRAQLELLLRQPLVGQIYVAGDGPKPNQPDQDKVAAVRQVIDEFRSKYPSRIVTKLAKSNVGCRRGVEQGLDWFFAHEDQGIILEDDCRPDPSFFRYCQELLKRYETDERVGMISGTKSVLKVRVPESYFFTQHSMIWGWATWKRAWASYREVQQHGLALIQSRPAQTALLKVVTPQQLKTIRLVLSGKIDTWDYIWYLTNILQARYCILPAHNLVSNVGFAIDATHTKLKTTQSELPVTAMKFPLRHPQIMLPNQEFANHYRAQQHKARVLLSVFWAYARSYSQKLRT